MHSLLNIKDYKITLYIGVSTDEQNNMQDIYIDIEVKFKSLPDAIATDNVKDSECYAVICDRLKCLNGKKIKTIEFLANQSFLIIKKYLASHYINIHIKKRPVIDGLQGGVIFSIKEY